MNQGIIVAIAHLSSIVVSCSFRLYLYFNFKRLKILSKKVNFVYEKFSLGCSPVKLHWIWFWGITGTLIYGLEIVLVTIRCLKMFHKSRINEESFQILNCALYAVTLFFCLFMPLNVFSIYYSVLCHQLTSILLEFAKRINQSRKIKYKALQKVFIDIRLIINAVDKNVSFFVMLCVMHSAAIMYFTITIILNPHLHGNALQRSAVCILCFSNFISFLTMIISASEVHQAYLLISDKADAFFQDDPNNVASEFRFFRIIDKEIAMTVWEIMPIKRSFIFETFGTLFTYSLLIYNLQV